MKKIEILTLASDEPRVTEAVGEMGVLHLTRALAEGGATPLETPESDETEARLDTLLAQADALCEALGISERKPPDALPHPTIQEAERELAEIENAAREITEERGALDAARLRLENLLRDTAILRDIDAPVEQLEQLSFLHFAIGGMGRHAAAATEEELGDRAVVLPYTSPYGEKKVVAISSKKGRWALESALEKHGFKRDKLPEDETGVPERIIELAEGRMGDVLARTKELNEALRAAAGEHADRLLAARLRIRTELRMMKARAHFAHTWATMLITGWLPEDRVHALCEAVLDITQGRAVIEIRDPQPDDDEPPTLVRNPSIFRPFELLVSEYSTPRYSEIEPTPFIAVLFVLMFGLMFGDVGHSGLLLIAGVALWLRGKGRWRDGGIILTCCSISGILFGVIYGSYFGKHEIGGTELGLLQPLKNVEQLLGITVLFGVGVISLGIILNIINRFRRREYAEGSFGKFGVIGGIFYWGSVTLAVRGLVGGDVSWAAVVLLVVAPLVLMFVYKPLAALRRQRAGERSDGLFLLVTESAIEAFEAVLLYLANTLSFARVAAFALAHAGLSLAIFELMAAARTFPGGPFWAGCVFVVGTLTILLLEGLIVAIQAMRFQYYEFFTKFFEGEGHMYRPFDLKTE